MVTVLCTDVVTCLVTLAGVSWLVILSSSDGVVVYVATVAAE